MLSLVRISLESGGPHGRRTLEGNLSCGEGREQEASVASRLYVHRWEIVLVHLWAVLHDRPREWATVATNWRGSGRCPRLPSNSTVSRRMPTPSVQALLQAVEQHLRDQFPPDACRFIDAKPLPIGGCGQDRDATYGRAAGCHAKGYKLYVIAGNSGGFLAWVVYPMSRNEIKVAPE